MRCLLLAFVVLLLVGGMAFAADSDDAPTAKNDYFQFSHNSQLWRDPALDPMSTSIIAPGPTQWSAYHARWLTGDHQFDIHGGLTGGKSPYAYGEMMDSGAFVSSMVYRYNGLFGGVVRPVARFTAGVGQDYRALGGPGFAGYGMSGTAFVAPELGIEIVYKGVGIGITQTQRQDFFDPSSDVTGPGVLNPQPNLSNWDEWLTNFYLILE